MIGIKEAEEYLKSIKEYALDKGWTEEQWNMYHNHIYGAANLAKKLAEKTGVIEPDRAFAICLLHDIGRPPEQYEQKFHGLYGYERLKDIDEDAARICLTHMFPWNQIEDYDKIKYFFFDKKEDYVFIKDYMENNPINELDKIIQLSDSLSNAYGLVTIEERNEEYTKRRGYSIPKKALDDIYSLKKYFDDKLGIDTYTLFDEIPNDYKLPKSSPKTNMNNIISNNSGR